MKTSINIIEFEEWQEEGSATLNICISYLLDNDTRENLLRDTLYTAYAQIKEENIHQIIASHFIAKSLSKLFNSHIKDVVIDAVINLYIDFLDDEAADVLLLYCSQSFHKSNLIALTDPDGRYQTLEIEQLNGSNQVFYCLQILKIIADIKTEENIYSLSEFIKCSKKNLYYLIEKSGKAIKKVAIWALYEIGEWQFKESILEKIEGEKLALLFTNLEIEDYDSNTKFRLAIILLRNSNYRIPDYFSHYTLNGAKELFNEHDLDKGFSLNSFTIPPTIEDIFIDLLDAPFSFWVDAIAIPTLCLYASERGLRKLSEHFFNKSRAWLKMGLILYKKGRLKVEHIKLIKSERLSFDRWIISMSRHLILEVKDIDLTGKPTYNFLLIEPEDTERYLKHVADGGYIKLENYGRIVAWCFGEEPTIELRNVLKKQYGFFI